MISPQSLLQFTTTIGNAIRVRPELNSAWVTAELSDVRVSGGHCYMELIEKNAAGSTVAKLRAMIWSSVLGRLRRKFIDATGRDIATGLKVMVQGTATHHPVYGLSMTIGDIDPSYTLGDIERLRREILERLQREGVLNRNKQLPLPKAPQRIAVISAAGAAGYGDFCNQLDSNQAGFCFYPHLFGAVLQGDRTSISVRQALQRIEMTIDLWDCVVIIRGGGATSDLIGFDDYELARAVAEFPLPVIVGIGHERDRCVLDEIANTRCKTPTAVASFLIDTLSAAWSDAERIARSIALYATERLKGETRRIAQIEVAVPSAAETALSRAAMGLGNMQTSLPNIVARVHEREEAKLRSYTQLINMAAPGVILREQNRLNGLENLCNALSPENTLRRGYSVTRINGRAVKNMEQLREGDKIHTTLYGGTLCSRVVSLEADSGKNK